eukprot:scaffold185848_cov19-Tisochrysis_lutea.AAC.1
MAAAPDAQPASLLSSALRTAPATGKHFPTSSSQAFSFDPSCSVAGFTTRQQPERSSNNWDTVPNYLVHTAASLDGSIAHQLLLVHASVGFFCAAAVPSRLPDPPGSDNHPQPARLVFSRHGPVPARSKALRGVLHGFVGTELLRQRACFVLMLNLF